MNGRENSLDRRRTDVAPVFIAVLILAAAMMVFGCVQTFAATTYTIHTESTNGTITDDKVVNQGDDWTVQFSPNDGYKLSYVEVDGARVEASTFYRFDDIQANHTVKVVYEKIPEYTIYTYVTHGSITENGTVLEGSDFDVTYSPDSGYRLARVEVDGTEVKNPNSYSFKNITSDHTISVTYEKIPSYNIYTYVTNGTITQNGVVTEGDDYEVIYEPYDGYRLSSVKVDGATVTNTHVYKFTNVTSAHVISVVYEKVPQYEIKTSVTNGTITENGLVNEGEDYEVTFEPKQGYQLSSVKVDGAEVGNLHTYKFINVKENHTISVEYVEKTQYKISTEVTNGTITETGYVDAGGTYSVVYEPKDGYRLSSVKVDGIEVTNPHVYQFTNVTQDHTIKVEFVRISEYKISTDVINGTITQTSYVNAGEDFEVVYEPKDGYRLASVRVDGTEVDNPHVYKFLNITRDHNISVEYVKITQYKISTDVTNGTITQHGYVYEGEDYTVVYEPKNGYRLASVKVDGTEIDNPHVYRFVNIKEDHSISVVYEKIPSYNILTKVKNGTITEDGLVTEGDNYTVKYYPDDGYKLEFVEVDGKEVAHSETSYTFEDVTRDHFISVQYTQIPSYSIDTVVEHGTITQPGLVKEGGKYKVSYRADKNCRLAYIEVDGERVEAPYGYEFENIQEDHIIKVVYEEIPRYTIFTEVQNGTITEAGTVLEGDNYDVLYNPNEGYQLYSVQVDGETVKAPLEYKFREVAENHTIKVVYEKTPKLSISETPDRNVYNAGDTIKYTVTVKQIQKNAEARNVVITNKLQDGLELVKDSFRGDGIEIVSQDYNTYEVKVPSITDTYSFTYEAITEKAVDSNSLVNAVTAIGDNTASSVTVTKEVSALTPKPTISQSVSRNTPAYMDELTYTIVVEEPQNGVSVRNAVVTNRIPSGITVDMDSIKTTGDEAKSILSDNILEVSIPELTEKTTITFKANVTAKKGTVDNVAVLNGDDINVIDASTTIYIHQSFLHLKATKAKKKAVYLKFNKVTGAKKYVIYGNICDHKGKVYTMKKIKTVKATPYDNYRTLKKIRAGNMKAGKFYKIKVIAYDVNGKKITTSNTIHVVTKGSKYKNNTGVKANKKTLNLKVGGTDKIRATAQGKKVKYHVKAIKYRSTNSRIATVSGSGKVVAKRAGTCKIYVYTQNGKYRKVTVNVR